LVEGLKDRLASALLVAFDLRGHGRSVGSGPTHPALSIEALCADASRVAQTYTEQHPHSPIFLIGHSLGGSIVTRIASGLGGRLLGVVVIDIVEETALTALRHMPQLLASRPSVFPTEEDAVQWALHTRTCRSRETAEISFLAQYRPSGANGHLVMITDLMGSRPYWNDWFLGLSELFLALPVSKTLILAETDYLDKPLLIGQMQGKFQLEIIKNTGHAIQEDQPKQLAELLSNFVRRNLDAYSLNHH
jgi:protein phosphatase methylesterase 1